MYSEKEDKVIIGSPYDWITETQHGKEKVTQTCSKNIHFVVATFPGRKKLESQYAGKMFKVWIVNST